MKKYISFFITCIFSLTVTLQPVSHSFLPITLGINKAYSQDSSSLPVVSEDQTNDLIEYCKEETEKSDEECENEVTQQNINDDEVSAVQKENEEFAQSFGVNHTSVTLIISAALQAIGTIIGFFGGGYKFPSNYLSLAVNCVLVIGYWINLAKHLYRFHAPSVSQVHKY